MSDLDPDLRAQYAAYQGLRVIGIDTGKEKEELSKKMGAEVFIDFKTEKDIVKAVKVRILLFVREAS